MDNIISFMIASAILAIIPGPDIFFVITQSITNGKKAGIFTAFGLGTGCLFHVACASFGISLIFKQFPVIINVVKFFGFFYLLYLAYSSYFCKHNKLEVAKVSKSGYLKGILMCILNPKVILFFLAFLPQFVKNEAKNFALEIFFLGIIFDLISISIFILSAILSSKLHEFIIKSEKFMKYVNKFASLSYIIIAFWIVFL